MFQKETGKHHLGKILIIFPNYLWGKFACKILNLNSRVYEIWGNIRKTLKNNCQ